MKRSLVFMFTVLACAWLAPAAAQSRLDSGASPRQQVRADLEWAVPLSRASGVSDKAFSRMVARIPGLDIRLDTSAFVNARARIYMTVPLPVQGIAGAGGLRINWHSEGLFEDGTLVPGQRALVYAGPVREPLLRDRLDMEVEVELAAMTGGEIRFEPEFEIEPF